MRKLISLGLLAIVLSILASPVLAGKVPVCEEIKGDPAFKGLYGLCNAYWNADNANAQEQILRNFNRKAGPDGSSMPGTGDERKKVTTCPCLDVISIVGVGIEDWGFTVGCTFDDDGTDQGLFVNPPLSNLTTWFTTTSDGVIHMCDITQSPDIQFMLSIDDYEYDECLSQLLMLCP